MERRAPDDGLVMQLVASRRDLALAVAVVGATVAWRTGANPVAAIASGILSAAIAFAIHRWCHGHGSIRPPAAGSVGTPSRK